MAPDIYLRILEDLETLRRRGTRLFGSGTHGYRLNPPLSEDKIADFESKHRTSLPEDYRNFLAHVGNGGAGPYYGVFKLGEMDDGFGYQPWPDSIVGKLSEPWPHRAAWNDLKDYSTITDEESQNAFDTKYWNATLVNGSLPICHLGCALRHWLVVTGSERGYVWDDSRADFGGLKPLATPTLSRVTFFDWYRRWIDESLSARDGGI